MLFNIVSEIILNVFFKDSYKLLQNGEYDLNKIPKKLLLISIILSIFIYAEEFIENIVKKILFIFKSIWDFLWIMPYVMIKLNYLDLSIYKKIQLFLTMFLKLRFNINLKYYNTFSELEREMVSDVMFDALK